MQNDEKIVTDFGAMNAADRGEHPRPGGDRRDSSKHAEPSLTLACGNGERNRHDNIHHRSSPNIHRCPRQVQEPAVFGISAGPGWTRRGARGNPADVQPQGLSRSGPVRGKRPETSPAPPDDVQTPEGKTVTARIASGALPENSRSALPRKRGEPPSVAHTDRLPLLPRGAPPRDDPEMRIPASRSPHGASAGFAPGRAVPPPGTVLAAANRIIGPLGAAGWARCTGPTIMKLGQALAYSSERLAFDPDRLRRLLEEVRTRPARSPIPNVFFRCMTPARRRGCTPLHGIPWTGRTWPRWIRRIGRLAPDKGVEIARQSLRGTGRRP